MTGEPPPFRREVYFRPWAFALAIVNATRCKYSRRRMGRLHLPQQNIDAVESLAIRIHREGKLSGYPPAVWIFIVLRLKTQKTPSCLPGMTGSDLAQSINVTESKHLLDRKVYFRSLECAIKYCRRVEIFLPLLLSLSSLSEYSLGWFDFLEFRVFRWLKFWICRFRDCWSEIR